MVPTASLTGATAIAAANDPDSLADAVGLKVWLVAQAFTPGPTTDKTALTLASFTGSAAKVGGAGAPALGIDPTTGRWKVVLDEPAGGWVWTCTADPASPQTITGYVVTDNAGTLTLGSDLLPTPVTISASGQILSIGEITLLLVSPPWQ